VLVECGKPDVHPASELRKSGTPKQLIREDRANERGDAGHDARGDGTRSAVVDGQPATWENQVVVEFTGNPEALVVLSTCVHAAPPGTDQRPEPEPTTHTADHGQHGGGIGHRHAAEPEVDGRFAGRQPGIE
jgi:hypothetical protein